MRLRPWVDLQGSAGRPLVDLAAFSFHETKNIISGEGGALAISNPAYKDRAEIIREKGANRSLFFRGQVDKYTWVDIGSSYLPGELSNPSISFHGLFRRSGDARAGGR